MFAIDPSRKEVAYEFKQKPLGVHSPELHAVLTTMRRMPIYGKHILVMTTPNLEWQLAVMEGNPIMPRILPEPVFTDPLDAEWYVFKLRWKLLTGEHLYVE